MSFQKLLLILLSFLIIMVGFAFSSGADDQIAACYEYLVDRGLQFVPVGIDGALATAVIGLLGGTVPTN